MMTSWCRHDDLISVRSARNVFLQAQQESGTFLATIMVHLLETSNNNRAGKNSKNLKNYLWAKSKPKLKLNLKTKFKRHFQN